MAQELEIKYAVEGLQQMDCIFCDPILCGRQSGPYRYIQMETTYFDTEDAQLARRHYTLRLRKENQRSVITVKTPIGPHLRGEWEQEGEDIVEALDALVQAGAPGELKALFAEEEPLPICGAKFVRIAAELRLEDGTVCEASGDMGELYRQGKSRTLCELEFELKDGSEAAMLALAKQIADKYGLKEETKSKHARALAIG